eukprot:scaffold10821_cov199-Amphora_coffeaeformis.AAC.12
MFGTKAFVLRPQFLGLLLCFVEFLLAFSIGPPCMQGGNFFGSVIGVACVAVRWHDHATDGGIIIIRIVHACYYCCGGGIAWLRCGQPRGRYLGSI